MRAMVNRIRYWREKRRLSRRELAEMVGCSHSQIVKLEREERQLRLHWMQRIAPHLGVEPAQLLPDSESVNGALNKLVYAPLITWEDVSPAMEADSKAWKAAEIKVPLLHNTTTVRSLPIHDTSLSRIAPPGYVIVFDYTDRQLVDGKYYVIVASGEKMARKYRDSDGPPRFEPDTPDPGYPTIYSLDAVEVVGRIVWAGKRL